MFRKIGAQLADVASLFANCLSLATGPLCVSVTVQEGEEISVG